MSLEGTAQRDNIVVFVQPLTKLMETPVTDGVINFQEAVDGRGTVGNITESNAVALVDTDCNECPKTHQFNAAGTHLCQHTQPRDSTLGTVKAHCLLQWTRD